MPNPTTETTLMQADALLERARAGDAAAQGKVMQLWYKRIYNFAYRFFYDHDVAMEVSQRTFIRMYQHLASLQEASRFKSWLYTIAVNTCREELRKRKQPVVPFSEWGEDQMVRQAAAAREANPDRVLRQAELTTLLNACLQELSEEQRTVLIMKEYEGMKFREIAEVLNISENTAKSRLYYGLNAMKQILERRNITRETIGYE